MRVWICQPSIIVSNGHSDNNNTHFCYLQIHLFGSLNLGYNRTVECHAPSSPPCLFTSCHTSFPHAYLHPPWQPAAGPSSGILTRECLACGKPPVKNPHQKLREPGISKHLLRAPPCPSVSTAEDNWREQAPPPGPAARIRTRQRVHARILPPLSLLLKASEKGSVWSPGEDSLGRCKCA